MSALDQLSLLEKLPSRRALVETAVVTLHCLGEIKAPYKIQGGPNPGGTAFSKHSTKTNSFARERLLDYLLKKGYAIDFSSFKGLIPEIETSDFKENLTDELQIARKTATYGFASVPQATYVQFFKQVFNSVQPEFQDYLLVRAALANIGYRYYGVLPMGIMYLWTRAVLLGIKEGEVKTLEDVAVLETKKNYAAAFATGQDCSEEFMQFCIPPVIKPFWDKAIGDKCPNEYSDEIMKLLDLMLKPKTQEQGPIVVSTLKSPAKPKETMQPKPLPKPEVKVQMAPPPSPPEEPEEAAPKRSEVPAWTPKVDLPPAKPDRPQQQINGRWNLTPSEADMVLDLMRHLGAVAYALRKNHELTKACSDLQALLVKKT